MEARLALAFKLLAGASKALDHEAVANFLEIGATSIEAGNTLRERQRDIVRAAAIRLQGEIARKTVTRGCAPNSAPIPRAEKMRRRR